MMFDSGPLEAAPAVPRYCVTVILFDSAGKFMQKSCTDLTGAMQADRRGPRASHRTHMHALAGAWDLARLQFGYTAYPPRRAAPSLPRTMYLLCMGSIAVSVALIMSGLHVSRYVVCHYSQCSRGAVRRGALRVRAEIRHHQGSLPLHCKMT